MDQPSLGRITAALASRAQLDALVDSLAPTLVGLLPADLVRLEHERSVRDRLAGRPGRPIRLSVGRGERLLVLDSSEPGPARPWVEQVVGGVTLSRRQVSFPQWLEALAAEIDRQAAEDDAARAALERLLLG